MPIALSIDVAGPQFLITLALIPLFGYGVLRVIRMMIDGDVGAVQGVVALFAVIGTLAIAITARSNAVTGAIALVTIALMAFFPYAATQMERLEHRDIRGDELDKAHRALAERPDNVNARFMIARVLYEQGMVGYAIATVEQTLAGLPDAIDPVHNRSVRDIYRNEFYTAKQWRNSLRDPKAFDPVKCPACGTMNYPGDLACRGCRGAYLLDLARTMDNPRRFLGKLVMAWALVALVLAAISMAALNYPSSVTFTVAALGIGTVGAVLWWLFRDPTMMR
ncbi:MAG TPA: hypothetical protein PLH94_07570 [Fimbriimonadaceae bacterium]|nr:hypothetical protein [Fimbriimonadaceae bacterium]